MFVGMCANKDFPYSYSLTRGIRTESSQCCSVARVCLLSYFEQLHEIYDT